MRLHFICSLNVTASKKPALPECVCSHCHGFSEERLLILWQLTHVLMLSNPVGRARVLI